MLTAASPVEIEAKAAEAGLTEAAHDVAIDLFHDLTNRIGQAVVSLDVSYQDWPQHRFYFAADASELDRLMSRLRDRADILDVSETVPAASGTIRGLFACAAEGGFSAVLVAHESHEDHVGAAENA